VSPVLKTLLHPSRASLLFALRTLGAGCLALALSLALHLDSPYWAGMTVWVVAQPTRGMVMAKSLYRLVGSAIGAAGAVLILIAVRGHGHEQTIGLALGLTFWVALCAAASHLLSSFRAYGAVLAGYSAVLVVMSAKPELALTMTLDYSLDIGLDRVATVAVGIICSGLVTAVFAPGGGNAAIAHARDLIRDMLNWLGTLLDTAANPDHSRFFPLTSHPLATAMAALEAEALHAGADSPLAHFRLRHLRSLVADMLIILAAGQSMGRHLSERQQAGANPIDGEAHLALATLAERLRNGAQRLDEDDQPLHEVLAETRAAIAATLARVDLPWQTTTGHVLHEKLGAITRALRNAGADFRVASGNARGRPAWKMSYFRDWRTAQATFFRSLAAMSCVATLTEVTGWSHGWQMMMATAIMSSVFVNTDTPAANVRKAMRGTTLALAAACLCRFWLFPALGDPWPGQLVVLPLLFLGTIVMSNRASAIAGTDFCLAFQMLAQPGMALEIPPPVLAESGFAMILGMSIAALALSYVLPSSITSRLRHLVLAMVEDLQDLALGKPETGRQAWAARSRHRVLRLALRTDPAAEADLAGALALHGMGPEILRLRAMRDSQNLSDEHQAAIATALDSLAHLRDDPKGVEKILRDAAVLIQGDLPMNDTQPATSHPRRRACLRSSVSLHHLADQLAEQGAFLARVIPQK